MLERTAGGAWFETRGGACHRAGPWPDPLAALLTMRNRDTFVARMQRSEIRGGIEACSSVPHFAPLHAGYACLKGFGLNGFAVAACLAGREQ